MQINYYLKALDIYIQQDDKLYQAFTYDRLGSIYFDLDNNDRGNVCLEKALVLAKEMKSTLIESNVLTTLGGNFVKLKEYDEGIKNLKSALLLAEKNDITTSVAHILYKISEAQYFKNSYELALENVQRGMEISKSTDNLDYVGDFLALRSKIFVNKPEELWSPFSTGCQQPLWRQFGLDRLISGSKTRTSC